ncbi:hypothetical protein [Pseudoxanthomonas dokdonensis]|uniref:Uncharacterized protein n=1 Tax=Pseudoxanthomonas dokdonensis TaxID=344882 RepID=A0A0R0CKT6_9GAMM|nr:hypothetical protein [Pseudoxanthomonas dokdonensis]KRG70604.1 hypothetical protein ABB29_05970 [Pseudoxanthomonas dokdonensis]
MWHSTRTRQSQENPLAQVVDIESELKYWQSQQSDGKLQLLGATRDALENCIKIGYDTYLLNHRQSFDEVQPTLQARYHKYRADDLIAWQNAQPVMQAIWQRLKGEPAQSQASQRAGRWM